MLEIKDLETGYGKKQVLFGLTLEVFRGEIVALIGPNGAGKSTVLKAACGLIRPWNGEIRFDNTLTNGFSPAQNVACGMTYTPQGSRVFSDLTVLENLEIGGFQPSKKKRKSRIAQVFEMFPVLKERGQQDAGTLSGGEQQMLAFARTLMTNPKLLMLDEPSLGLSPNLLSKVFDTIVRICNETGVAVLIVEQKVHEILQVCNRVYAIKLGRIVYDGVPEEIKEDKAKLKDIFL